MRPGQVERRTHDYKRHGTTTLFAALDIKVGKVIAKCMPRHRASEFRKFIDEIEENVQQDLDIHIVMKNDSSNKTKLIYHWYHKRPHRQRNFKPQPSSTTNKYQ